MRPEPAPLQLDRDARALLNAVEMFQGDFRIIDPSQDRIAQRLSCMGVIELRASQVTLCGFAFPVSEAAITDAGLRALHGPQLVRAA